MDFLWNLNQEQKISDSKNVARDAAGQASRVANEVRDLENRLERLALINKAVWELLRDATGTTNEELKAKMEEIQQREASPDGQTAPSARQCPKCSRNMAPKARRCIYCGTLDEPDDPFV